MDDGDGNGEVEAMFGVGEGERVGDDGGVGLVSAGYLCEVGGAVGADDEDVRVDEEVLPVAAADVEADGAGRERLEEGFDDGPGFVAGRGEVRGDLFVDFVHVFGFVAFGSGGGAGDGGG